MSRLLRPGLWFPLRSACLRRVQGKQCSQWKILTRVPTVNTKTPSTFSCLALVQTLCYTFITTNLSGTENTWAHIPGSTESTRASVEYSYQYFYQLLLQKDWEFPRGLFFLRTCEVKRVQELLLHAVRVKFISRTAHNTPQLTWAWVTAVLVPLKLTTTCPVIAMCHVFCSSKSRLWPLAPLRVKLSQGDYNKVCCRCGLQLFYVELWWDQLKYAL